MNPMKTTLKHFYPQLERIEGSEASPATQAMAKALLPQARGMLGDDLSVFWDADDDEIIFYSERGEITVGGPTGDLTPPLSQKQLDQLRLTGSVTVGSPTHKLGDGCGGSLDRG